MSNLPFMELPNLFNYMCIARFCDDGGIYIKLPLIKYYLCCIIPHFCGITEDCRLSYIFF